MVARIHKVLQINSGYNAVVCQLASATNDIRFIFTKYNIADTLTMEEDPVRKNS